MSEEIKYTCSLCQGDSFRRIPFRYLFKGKYLYAMKCRLCGLISIFPRPTSEEISAMYSDDYFTVADKKTHHGNTDYISDIETADYSKPVASLKNIVPGGNFLEIGCATGSLLNAMKNDGYDVTGIELSSFAAEFGRKNYGINIINKPFEKDLLDNDLKENTFDGILMGDVLEHFTDPFASMQLAFRLLKKDGKLITNVPGTLNLISSRMAFAFYRLTGREKTMTIPPYHLTEFSPASLRKMFYKSGFASVQIIQKTKHPKTIPLRHSRIENFVKLSTQYPNYYLTKFFGILGDRITGIGTK